MAIDYTKDRAYRFFDQGKVEGAWNPDDIDFTRDEEDWEEFSDEERAQFLRSSSGFYDGEEDVTRTLAPYLMALDKLDADRLTFDPIHAEMYLSQQIYEEAKHTDFFARWYDRVVGSHDTDEFRVSRDDGDDDDDGYSGLEGLYPRSEELARTALDGDHTEILHKLGAAVMHYMGLIEGQAARVGYIRFDQMLESKAQQMGRDEVLPGYQEAIRNIRDDEGRHIGHGQWLLQGIAETDPAVVTEVYQPMLEDYVDRRLARDRRGGEEAPLRTDPEALDEAFENYLQETVDIIGRERFEGFSRAEELLDQREAQVATGDD